MTVAGNLPAGPGSGRADDDGGRAGSGGGRGSSLLASVAQVLAADESVAGTGFVVGEDIVITCAHVVHAAGQGPGGRVEFVFPHVPGAPRVAGQVLADQWRAPEAEDVAVVRLERVPAGVRVLSLGAAAGCRGHRISSYGFPAQALKSGHFGYGTAGDLLPTPDAGQLLQLSEANELTTGFSGGPIVDEVTGLVIGMVTAIIAPDTHLRGLGIAYGIPVEVLREVRPELTEQQVRPYRGLEPFTAEHAAWFHGREAVVENVLAALGSNRRGLLLLGPSGAGKSSLIQAGVLPALAEGAIPNSDRWLPLLARPGQDLPAELEHAGLPGAGTDGLLAAAERRLATEPGHDRLILVIDQFEELFTQPQPPLTTNGQGPDRRMAVAQELAALIDSPAPVTVLLVMRDDFYPRLAALAPDLLAAATRGLLNVPATLSRPELNAIITRPAQTAGARIEDGLPERIISDILAADPTRQAPVTLLPPLELALSQLWDRRMDGRLTHDAYQRIGEVTGTLATWCNTAITQLPAAHQSTAKRILTALVRPADEAHAIPATRQQVPLSRLRALVADPTMASPTADAVFDAVVAALSRDRIITTGSAPQSDAAPGEPMAELIHDALLRDWSDLRDWVAQDQQFQVWLHRATEQQERHARSSLPGDLLDGSLLTEGLNWAEERPIPADVDALLTTSRRHQQRAIRRIRSFVGALAGMLVLALIATGISIYNGHSATVAQQLGLSRQLAAQSTSLLPSDPDLALLLAVHAYRVSHTAEATASLENVADFPLKGSFPDRAGADFAIFDPHDSNVLAVVDEKDVQLRDVSTGKILHTFTHVGEPYEVAFDPHDRNVLAIVGERGVQLWNTASGRPLRTFSHMGYLRTVAFRPDGRSLATGDADGNFRLWDAHTGKRVREFLRPADSTGEGDAKCVVFSPDGRTLAGCDGMGTWLWNADTGKLLRGSPGNKATADNVAFSPDGKRIVTGPGGTVGDTTHLWATSNGQEKATLSSTGFVSTAFSSDGKTVVTSGESGVQLWDATTGQLRATLSSAPGTSATLSRDGHTLATIDAGGQVVRLWDATSHRPRESLPCTGNGMVTFSPRGREFATVGSLPFLSRAMVWNTFAGEHHPTLRCNRKGKYAEWFLHPLVAPDGTLGGFPVAFSPDGRLVATGESYGITSSDFHIKAVHKTYVWNSNGGTSATLPVASKYVEFNPMESGTLATVGDGGVRVWDLDTRKAWLLPRTSGDTGIEFSPDGRILVTFGGEDQGVHIWNVATHKVRVLTSNGGYSEVVFNPRDSRSLATVNDVGVRVWDLDTRKARDFPETGGEQTEMIFSPDGQTFATFANTREVRVSDLVTGHTQALSGTKGSSDAAFNPKDSRMLATVGNEGVRLWDTAIAHVRTTLDDSGTTNQVFFSPDGHTLATNDSNSAPVRLWDVSLPDLAETTRKVCKAVHRDLTPKEWSKYLPGQSRNPVCTS